MKRSLEASDKGKEKEKDVAAPPEKKAKKSGGGGILDKIMGSMDGHQKERGKPTLSVEAQEFITKLTQLLAVQEENMEGRLEIEMRFGVIDETKFVPGITKEQFGALYKYLKERQNEFRFYKQTITTDYYYSGESKDEKFRASYDEKTHTCVEALTKSLVMNRDLPLRSRPTFLYDIRISISNEYDEEKPDEPPPEPVGIRKKERWSFIDTVNKYWTVDMTRVSILDPADCKTVLNVLHEIEIELLPSTIPKLHNPVYNRQLCERLWMAISNIQREIKRSGIVVPTAPPEGRHERRVVHRPHNNNNNNKNSTTSTSDTQPQEHG